LKKGWGPIEIQNSAIFFGCGSPFEPIPHSFHPSRT
jgi:hypothetical protein